MCLETELEKRQTRASGGNHKEKKNKKNEREIKP
jgi:hypothetical protein